MIEDLLEDPSFWNDELWDDDMADFDGYTEFGEIELQLEADFLSHERESDLLDAYT